jgi:hypothetical protein
MDRWLNGCIAVERAFNIIKGINFNKKKSQKITKYTINFLVLLTISTTIYDPIYRRLVEDNNNNDDDEQKRIWCIVSYSKHLLVFNKFIHMFHFFVPVLMNSISSIVIITMAAKKTKNY